MKTLLIIPIIAGFGAILSSSELRAAEFVTKSFGGFTQGQEFKLTVTEKVSIHTSGSRVTKNAPVPDGMPDFNKGRSVKFMIGRGGRLTGSGFSIRFQSGKPRINLYSNNPSGFTSDGEAATVSKNSNRKATGATLTFYKFRFSGFRPVTDSVSYVLE